MAIISAIVEIRYMIRINNQTATYDFLNSLNASVVEEIAKYAVGVFAILYSSKIHRITDVITFMIIVGLGFAITEDAVYLLNPSINAPERLISFYLHSGTAAIMGYAMGQLRFGLGGYRNLLRAIFYAIFLHLAYNSCSLLSNDKLGLWLSLGVVVCIGLQVIITFRKATANDIALEENNIPT